MDRDFYRAVPGLGSGSERDIQAPGRRSTGMSVAATVRDYYEALRRGEPLYPYFLEDPSVVKFGIGERLTGYEAVAEGLREQTRVTTDWRVESSNLRVGERDDRGHGWFSDDVHVAWRDVEAGREYAFDTRWSGTVERRDEEWLFAGMHVSVAHDWGNEDESDGEGEPAADPADGTVDGSGRADR